MHTYTAKWPEHFDADDGPSILDFRFNKTLDIVEWAEHDRTLGWKTWPEVWHLDDDGKFTCYYPASSLSSIKRWADDPGDLFRSRWEGTAEGRCGSRWVIVDSQPTWHGPAIDEGDAAAFLIVRAHLARVGVRLVDDVIFDDERHWWSLNELITGSLEWTP